MKRILLSRRGAIAASVLLSVIAASLGLVPYLLIWRLAAVVAGTGSIDTGEVTAAALLAAGAVCLKALCGAASTHVSHLAAYATLADLRRALTAKLSRIPLAVFHERSPSDLKRVMAEDVDQLEDAIAHAVPDLAAGLSVPLISGVVLLCVDWRLGLASMAMFPLLIAFYFAALRSSKRNSPAYLQALMRMKSAGSELVQGMKIIRTFMRADATLDRFGAAVDELAATGQAYATASLGWMALFYAGLRANLLLIVPVGAALFLTGRVDAPDFILALLVGMGMNASAFRIILTAGTFFWRMKSSGARISGLLDMPELDPPEQPRQPCGSEIRFDDVVLTAGDRPILRGISFSARDGCVTALVGPSGAGKTSILRLLARYRDPDGGRISIGGTDIRHMDPQALLASLSIVFQDAWLMNDTIRANIRMGRPEASDEQVAAAARAARVLEFAPDLDMPAGEAGRLLSGGQRQRVTIARAILADRPIVLLDEATASLDPENEALVLEALRELARGRTVIVVAHRLHTIRHADRIVYLEDGRIEASGTHERLLAACPGYARAWENYQAVEGWSLDKSGGGSPPVPQVAAGERQTQPELPEPRLHGSTLRALLDLAGPMRGPLLRRAAPLLVLESIMATLPVVAVWHVLDRALAGSLTAATAGLASLVILACLAMQALVNTRSHHLLWRVQTGAVAALQMRLGRKLVAAPLGVVLSRDTGALETIVTRTATELNFLSPCAQIVRILVAPAAVAALLFIVDWRLALPAVAILWPFGAIVSASDRISRQTMRRLQLAREALAARILDFVEGMPALRSYGLGETGFRALAAASEHHRQLSNDITRRLTRVMAVGWAILDMGFVLLLAVGGYMVANGAMPAQTWLLFLVVGLAFYAPIADAFELTGVWRQQQGVIGRLNTVLDMPVLPEPALPVRPASLDLRFENVSFSYGDMPTLTSVNLDFPAGRIHAIIGPSGAGKSTVLNLLARLWDPDEGRISVGGADLREIGSAMHSRLFAIVFQDTFLFDDTVHANIAVGRPDASPAEVEEAARLACCHDFITQMESGYDTRIGEKGAWLSGGEKQRIAIARALLKDAPIVLLDEATASIDPENEASIRRAIAGLCRGKTVILIAHRPETILNVDQVVKLQGRQAETQPQAEHQGVVSSIA